MELEELKQEWSSYNKHLEELLSIQRMQLKTNLLSRAKRQANRLVCQEFLVCIFTSIVIVVVSAHYRLYLDDRRYLVSFALFLITMLLYLGHEIFLLSLWLKRFNLEESLISSIRAIELYKKHEKIQLIASLIIGVPILLTCFTPLAMLILNKGNFYNHIYDLLPILLIGTLISIAIGIIFYMRIKKTLEEIQRNLNKLSD